MALSTPVGFLQPESSRRLYSYHCWRLNFLGRRLAMARRSRRPSWVSFVRVGLAWALCSRGVVFSTILTSSLEALDPPTGAFVTPFFVGSVWAGFSACLPVPVGPVLV